MLIVGDNQIAKTYCPLSVLAASVIPHGCNVLFFLSYILLPVLKQKPGEAGWGLKVSLGVSVLENAKNHVTRFSSAKNEIICLYALKNNPFL